MITRKAANRLKYAITDLSHFWTPVRVFRKWLCKIYHLDEANIFCNNRLAIQCYPPPYTVSGKTISWADTMSGFELSSSDSITWTTDAAWPENYRSKQ